jgi:adenylate cyclase
MFGQYVPPALVAEMNRNPDGHFGFEGESREMTVLFCDIRDFTTLSEALPANELKRLLNYFFTPMTQIIFENRGTVDKYVGDMIMAFWGAPLADADHRLHGIVTALRMLEKLRNMQDEFKAQQWPALHIGVGLNSGMMNVGDMGSTYRRAYTVLGDTVNMASRFEGLTKFYSVRLIVGEETRHGLEERVLFRLLDKVRVKGAKRGITIYEPICLIEEADPALQQAVALHQQAMEHYFARRWEQAEAIFQGLHEPFGDEGFYKLIRGRIDTLRNTPPGEEWDGIFTHTTK